ncbi:hypothetical protein [Paraburkholderia mimosarum]|uniref:hypothetical protein n=1 Tax=Paraburkholderia mimosarum TaxID=312026 RepID=UPI0004889B38|nr:hypothetical protein [Paraburkholderia mimosarum]
MGSWRLDAFVVQDVPPQELVAQREWMSQWHKHAVGGFIRLLLFSTNQGPNDRIVDSIRCWIDADDRRTKAWQNAVD